MEPSVAQPVHGLIGGIMIGLAAATMLFALGRIAGVSGLAARAFGLVQGPPRGIAIAFIVGLPTGAALVVGWSDAVLSRFPSHVSTLVIAGLLVGFGTRLGSGCTSGHGVCGVSRLSPRSLAATATFMGAGVATVAMMRMLGLPW